MHELPCPFHQDAICREGRCPLFPEVEKAADLLVKYLNALEDDSRSIAPTRYLNTSNVILEALDSNQCAPDYIL